MRVGFGYDSHRLVEGRRLILGGVEIPSEKGLWGHSDADVLVHAVCDALLGSIAAGDIGTHFPDTDPAYQDVSSLTLLTEVGRLVEVKGYEINNIDATVVLEIPKLNDYKKIMGLNIAASLNIAADKVNVKAKTNEGMGFVGRREGVVAFAVATVQEKQD
jgi:2-C-methyl-D-erythritol 2,4-cyclodiphosphate synthase